MNLTCKQNELLMCLTVLSTVNVHQGNFLQDCNAFFGTYKTAFNKDWP
jgi:hypothetical protein